jgi:hypothetical protein
MPSSGFPETACNAAIQDAALSRLVSRSRLIKRAPTAIASTSSLLKVNGGTS